MVTLSNKPSAASGIRGLRSCTGVWYTLHNTHMYTHNNTLLNSKRESQGRLFFLKFDIDIKSTSPFKIIWSNKNCRYLHQTEVDSIVTSVLLKEVFYTAIRPISKGIQLILKSK